MAARRGKPTGKSARKNGKKNVRRSARQPKSRKAANIKPRKTARKPRRHSPRQGKPPQVPPAGALMQMLTGYWLSKAVSTAARLGIADKLAKGPLYYVDLAAAVGAHTKTLHRLMRALASVGVFAEPAPGRFALTPLSQLLRGDVPGSLRDMAVMITTPSHWLPWGRLDESVVKGISVAEDVFGKPLWDYYRENPEEGAWFNGAMSAFTAMTGEAVAAAYDLSGCEHIVDVGGGHGLLLATLLRAAPASRGVLFDLPQTVAGAGAFFEEVSSRVDVVGGDFFKAVPAGGDCYVLKHILHDWADAQCAQILANLRRAMAPEGRVLVIETLVPETPGPHHAHLMDLNMLALTPGGCERTEREFAGLFARAGLRLREVVPTQSPVNVIVAVPE
ncbi:MAG: hypothetical protein IT463_13815 [Planctomycetes bacterium]|nr:hypothetical protein [Planctomycetota bacterium]